jgi:hypothetical protein
MKRVNQNHVVVSDEVFAELKLRAGELKLPVGRLIGELLKLTPGLMGTVASKPAPVVEEKTFSAPVVHVEEPALVEEDEEPVDLAKLRKDTLAAIHRPRPFFDDEEEHTRSKAPGRGFHEDTPRARLDEPVAFAPVAPALDTSWEDLILS